MLLEKKRKQEEEQQQKEERKRQREEKRKERLIQAENKKIIQEEKKKQRELQKKKKEEMKKKTKEDKELKALLAGSQKGKKESESSDSGEEPVYDDNSDDACEDITDLCNKCGITTRQEVRIQCILCDEWWHANCVTQMDLQNKSQEDLDAMDIEFMCCTDQIAVV